MARRDEVQWPEWWTWELELSPHLWKRMIDRDFTETDLRLMMEEAIGYRGDHEADRWVIETAFDGEVWEVIVKPDAEEQTLVVVTAYPVN